MRTLNIKENYNITTIALLLNVIIISLAAFTNSYKILNLINFAMTIMLFILLTRKKLNLKKYLVAFLIIILVFTLGWYLIKHEMNWAFIRIYIIQSLFLLSSLFVIRQYINS